MSWNLAFSGGDLAGIIKNTPKSNWIANMRHTTGYIIKMLYRLSYKVWSSFAIYLSIVVIFRRVLEWVSNGILVPQLRFKALGSKDIERTTDVIKKKIDSQWEFAHIFSRDVIRRAELAEKNYPNQKKYQWRSCLVYIHPYYNKLHTSKNNKYSTDHLIMRHDVNNLH